MQELTLESLASRLASLEQEMASMKAGQSKNRNWRSKVGLFDDDPDFMRQVIAEGNAIREADRRIGNNGEVE